MFLGLDETALSGEMSASTNKTSARNTLQQAFDDLKHTVSSGDSKDFDSTTLHDVRIAARDIERQLRARQKSSNMRRLEPLFDGLDHYSKAIEVVCNGTPYLPWIWAPMKLILQVSSGIVFSGVLEWALRIIMRLLPDPTPQSGAQKIVPSDPLPQPLTKRKATKIPRSLPNTSTHFERLSMHTRR
jgi:hypothetical protein